MSRQRPRVLLVVNPYSSGLNARRERAIVQTMREYMDIDVQRTERPAHAIALAAEGVQDNIDVIVACGGDGTANEIVNGMKASDDTAADRPALAVLPAGATNVLARSLGLPNDPLSASRVLTTAILSQRSTAVNLGALDERLFLFAGGVGIDGEVVKRKETNRSGRRSSDLAYIGTVLGVLLEERGIIGERLTITVDGADHSFRAALVMCANTAPFSYLGRLKLDLLPEAGLERGLEVLAPRKVGPSIGARYVAYALGMLRRPFIADDKLQIQHDVDSLLVESDTPQACQCDGEYLGDRTRVTIGVRRNAIRLIS